MFILYAIWMVIGLTNHFPYWAVFVGPIPVILLFYLIWFIISYTRHPERFGKEARMKDLEADYQDLKL